MQHEQINPRSLDELHQRNEQLEAMCRLWIAANQAKQERIDRLEGQVHRLRRQLCRLRHFIWSRRAQEPASQPIRLARP